MGKPEDESTISVEDLLEQFVVQAGGQAEVRRLLQAEKKRLSGLSIQARGDEDCLEKMALIDQLVDILDKSIEAASTLGIGTTGQEALRASSARR